MKLLNTLIIILLVLNLFSCKKEKEYGVHSEFEPYVQRFTDEGNQRGKSFNFHETGLIIEFADLVGASGRCHYEDPIRIEIDRTNWNKFNGENNEDLIKEGIILHELCHGFLYRDHKNDYFSNGDWASRMRGGDGIDPPDGRKSWTVNYRGFRHDYYLDELFDENTQAPDWAYLQPVFSDNPDDNIVFVDDFSSNINNWWTVSEADRQAEIADGQYRIQTTRENGFYLSKEISLDKTRDFYIELNIKFSPIVNNGDWHDAGLVWGGNEGTNLYYLSYTQDKRITIGNYINYGWYIDVPCPSLITDDFNKVVVRKIDDIFYFSINGTFVYHTDYDGLFGDKIGFRLDGNSTIWIDKIQVSYLGTTSNKSIEKVTVSNETYIGKTPKIKIP